MKTTHFNLIMIALLAVVGGLGYFSFSTIKYGVTPKAPDVQTVQVSTDDPLLDPVNQGSTSVNGETTGQAVVQPAQTATSPSGSTSQYGGILASLQDMLDKKTVLNSGQAKGDNVRTIQEFLNIYDKKNVAANANFGPTTTARVKEFQKANFVPTTGNVGPQTLQKMVDWLKTQ